jgi:hypothetical protein
LKSEKTRHVVKIGPMHLKGVWYVYPHEHVQETARSEQKIGFHSNAPSILRTKRRSPRCYTRCSAMT